MIVTQHTTLTQNFWDYVTETVRITEINSRLIYPRCRDKVWPLKSLHQYTQLMLYGWLLSNTVYTVDTHSNIRDIHKNLWQVLWSELRSARFTSSTIRPCQPVSDVRPTLTPTTLLTYAVPWDVPDATLKVPKTISALRVCVNKFCQCDVTTVTGKLHDKLTFQYKNPRFTLKLVRHST